MSYITRNFTAPGNLLDACLYNVNNHLDKPGISQAAKIAKIVIPHVKLQAAQIVLQYLTIQPSFRPRLIKESPFTKTFQVYNLQPTKQDLKGPIIMSIFERGIGLFIPASVDNFEENRQFLFQCPPTDSYFRSISFSVGTSKSCLISVLIHTKLKTETSLEIFLGHFKRHQITPEPICSDETITIAFRQHLNCRKALQLLTKDYIFPEEWAKLMKEHLLVIPQK